MASRARNPTIAARPADGSHEPGTGEQKRLTSDVSWAHSSRAAPPTFAIGIFRFRTTNMHVCAVTDGTLRYALASDWNTVGHPGGNYGSETHVGTLSR